MTTLLRNAYGKGRVRVMRVHREGEGPDARCDVRELTVRAMLTGDFGRAYTDADNSTSLCTDTVKNVVNAVAAEAMTLDKEAFCAAVAGRLLDAYPQVGSATVTGHETRWSRLAVGGAPHPHAFTLDGNGQPFARVVATRDGAATTSGVSGFTFLKATQSGWAGFPKDRYTTLPETTDRIAATSMEASWLWSAAPADYEAANAAILSAMLEVFATTYSHSVQDSLYRMGAAALEAVPEVAELSMACPNKHYVPINLAPLGLENGNRVFVATDEPHGQIECTVGR